MVDLSTALHNELHARPFPVVHGASQIFYVAVRNVSENDERDHVARFPVGTVELPAGRFAAFSTPAGELRIERHNEFNGYTLVCPSSVSAEDPFPPPSPSLGHWLNGIPGERVLRIRVGLQVRETTTPRREDLVPILGDYQLCGALCSEGAAAVWTAFHHDIEGWTRFLIHDLSLQSARRAGRLVQRLLDAESYRCMALLALPQARALASRLTEMEDRLTETVGAQVDANLSTHDRDILERLTALSLDVEHARSDYGRRASATTAYAAIFERRMNALREERLDRFQTLSEFLERSMTPAFRTCSDTSVRLDQLSVRLDRATDLLRTQVDITLEDQNRELLASLDRRTEAGLRLQETVEGLSVVAISYYLVALLQDVLEGLHGIGVEVHREFAILIALPFIVLLTWRSVHTIRRAVRHR